MNADAAHGPLFLVGCPRSGTTLLQLLLDSHSRVAVAPETHFVRRFWLRRKKYGDLEMERPWRRLVDDICQLPEFAGMGLDPEDYRERARAGSHRIERLFLLLLERFAALRGKQWIGEKTPNHLLYMRTLEKWYPQARFLHIVRDPRAVARSWQGLPWSNGSLVADADVWRKYLTAARERPPRNPERILTLRYESLVSDPEAQLSAVCDFIGIPFEPAMLEFHAVGREQIDARREPWKESTLRPIDEQGLLRWQTDLSTAEIAAIEAATWPEIVRAGYRPTCSLPRLLPGRIAAAGRRRLKELRRSWRRRRRSLAE